MPQNSLRVGQASLPVEPREFSYSRHHTGFEAEVDLALEVQIKVVRARTLAHHDRQGRLSYLSKLFGISSAADGA
jgi:hypothetical protein